MPTIQTVIAGKFVFQSIKLNLSIKNFLPCLPAGKFLEQNVHVELTHPLAPVS